MFIGHVHCFGVGETNIGCAFSFFEEQKCEVVEAEYTRRIECIQIWIVSLMKHRDVEQGSEPLDTRIMIMWHSFGNIAAYRACPQTPSTMHIGVFERKRRRARRARRAGGKRGRTCET